MALIMLTLAGNLRLAVNPQAIAGVQEQGVGRPCRVHLVSGTVFEVMETLEGVQALLNPPPPVSVELPSRRRA